LRDFFFQVFMNMDDLNYDTTGLTYVETFYFPEYEEKKVAFLCELYAYTAHCFQNIIQFVGSQTNPKGPLSDGSYPTPEQIEGNNLRKEQYNQNHQPLQVWIDNLT